MNGIESVKLSIEDLSEMLSQCEEDGVNSSRLTQVLSSSSKKTIMVPKFRFAKKNIYAERLKKKVDVNKFKLIFL